MSAALALFRLQQVDSHIAQIESRLGQIRAKLANDVQMQSALRQLEAAQAEQRTTERAQRGAEQEAQALQVRIQQVESSLYGGSVHNPKELQDLQSDVASMKKQLGVLEERELEAMFKTEASQSAQQQAQAELGRLRAELGDEHVLLAEEESQLVRELERYTSERQATVGAVAAGMLDDYEGLRQTRRGMAVSEVAENGCRACGTTLTAALQQSARHAAELVHCPSCGRILYAV